MKELKKRTQRILLSKGNRFPIDRKATNEKWNDQHPGNWEEYPHYQIPSPEMSRWNGKGQRSKGEMNLKHDPGGIILNRSIGLLKPQKERLLVICH